MAKLTKEQKIEIYNKRKKGLTISSLAKKYSIRISNVNYLVALIDLHGEEILHRRRNTSYSKGLKQEMINKVLLEGWRYQMQHIMKH